MSLEVNIEKKLDGFTLRAAFSAGNTPTALLGASGCGKSMTLRCIAGILKPDAGRTVLDGRVLFDSAQHIDLPPQQRGALLGGAQLLLHGAALGQVGLKLDDLEGLALRVKNGVVGGLDPDAPPVLAQAQVFAAVQLARSQLFPELHIRLGLRISGLAEHAVVLAHDLLEVT